MKFEFTSTIMGSSKYLSFGLSDDDDMVSVSLTFNEATVLIFCLSVCEEYYTC